ncbi:MAG: efflux RND transporter periplasmic adaptor subunit, partial [Bacteroidota bacterium]
VSFNKKYAYIYASADGFITKKIANEGEVVNGGQPVLAINELGSKRSWVLKVGVADKEWAAIRLGSKASVVVDAFPGYTFPAVVSRKSQAADPLSGSFQVELKLEADRKDLAVGMFGKASIQLAYKLNRASIPYDAVIEANGKDAYVFVPASKTTVKKVPITIDSFDNTEVTISQGLEDIEEIVVSNSAFLNEKSTIKIVK